MSGKSSMIKPHHKVRTGCFACKSRRIKCDERKPQCSRCERYSEECIYPNSIGESSRSTRHASELSAGGRHPPREVPKDIDRKTTDLNTSDLELMHHWTLSAYTGFGYRPGAELIWRDEIPRMALKQPFLMRGLLEVSALHLARLHPEQKDDYYAIASHHQNLALPSYRYLVEDIENRMTAENCNGIAAFGALTTAYGFASPHPPGSVLFAGLCSSTGVPEWLILLRGTRGIFAMAKDLIANGPLQLLFQGMQESMPETIDVSLSPEDLRLSALGAKIDSLQVTTPEEYHELDIHREAFFLLRQEFAIPCQPGEILGVKAAVFFWVEGVPAEFLELLSSVKPIVLVILAHLCILLKECENYWYIKGAAERIIWEVNNILEERWRPLIAWPLQVVQIGVDRSLEEV